MDSSRKKASLYKDVFPLENRLALMAGDFKGVGFFVLKQALKKIGPKKNFQFLIWCDKNSPTLKLPRFKTLVFKNSELAFKSSFKENSLLQIKSSGTPADNLVQAGKKALNGRLSALITGPVSKLGLKKYQAVGQTDLLKKISGVREGFMCFRGSFFNVILLTDHTPLKKVSLKEQQIKTLLDLALSARDFLPPAFKKKPLGFLALNPHAGEQGLLGFEERSILKPLLKAYKEVEGPLAPDTAFFKKNWKKYSFFISVYHDQGLIPFKMIHQERSFAWTLGLPFLRLGVSHGTGQNLKQKEISSHSFYLALREAISQINKNKKTF